MKDHTVKLNIDDKVIPIAQPQRRIPFHVRDKVKEAIEKLEKEGIIERVPENQPTPWVSPVVVVPKSDGKVRLSLDMRMANQAIQRVCHLIPTVEDISLDLNQAKYFTKLDLSQAYHQLPLAASKVDLLRLSALISDYFRTLAFHMASMQLQKFFSILYNNSYMALMEYAILLMILFLVIRNSSTIQPLNNVSNVYQTRD